MCHGCVSRVRPPSGTDSSAKPQRSTGVSVGDATQEISGRIRRWRVADCGVASAPGSGRISPRSSCRREEPSRSTAASVSSAVVAQSGGSRWGEESPAPLGQVRPRKWKNTAAMQPASRPRPIVIACKVNVESIVERTDGDIALPLDRSVARNARAGIVDALDRWGHRQEGGAEDVVHGRHEGEHHVRAHLIGHVAEILLVRLRQDHFAEPGAVGGQHLFLDAADLERLAAQGDLAGHRHVAPHRPAAASTLAIASVTAIPALGPSLGIAPAGK